MDINEIKAHLVKIGWVLDKRSGHYHKAMRIGIPDIAQVRECRVKFNKHSLTIEMHASTNAFWLRIGGASYGAIRRTADGGVQVITFFFPAS